MKTRSEDTWDALQAKVVGLGERSFRKSYYPKLQEKLSELERFKALLDRANDMIFLIHGPTGKLVDVSRSMCVQLGYSREELLGMRLYDVLPVEAASVLADLGGRDLVDGEGPEALTTGLLTRNGRELPVEITLSLVTFNQVLYFVAVARDIAERKRSEERIAQQNEFLNTILESISHPFYVLDAVDFTITMANSAACPNGVPPNTTCFALTHRSDKPCGGAGDYCPVEIIKKTRKSLTTEHTHYDDQGNARHVEVHAHPIFDGDGNVVQIIEYVLDITERKKMEKALQKARDELELRVLERTAELRKRTADLALANEALRLDEMRLQALWELRQMHDASEKEIAKFVVNRLVRITESQFGMLGFMDKTESALTFHVWFQRVSQESIFQQTYWPVEEAGIWAEAVTGRKPVIINHYENTELLLKGCPLGNVPIYRVMSVPLVNNEQIVAVATTANKDVDYDESDVRQVSLLLDGMWRHIEQERAEIALRNSESLAAMGRALSSAAHDIKIPLIAIGGFTKMVHRHLAQGSEDREKLEIVLKETGRLEMMVKDMLDFSRPLELHKSLEDACGIIKETFSVVDSAAKAKEVFLEFNLNECGSPISIDVVRIKQALINLVMNAIQASSKGKTVMVNLYRQEDKSIFEVVDCGCGIPLNQRSEIFSPFFTTKKDGTGLGLSIVKKIVDAHKGRVEVLDNPGAGVTFRVALPIAA